MFLFAFDEQKDFKPTEWIPLQRIGNIMLHISLSIMYFHNSQVRVWPCRSDCFKTFLYVKYSEHMVLPGMQSTVWIWAGPDPEVPQCSGKPCSPCPPCAWLLLKNFYWRTWHTWFSILAQGTQKTSAVAFPQFKSRIMGAHFMHVLQTHFFSLPSVVWLLFYYVSNQQLTHGGLLPLWGSEHSIPCRGSIPHGWLPLTLSVAASRTFMLV